MVHPQAEEAKLLDTCSLGIEAQRIVLYIYVDTSCFVPTRLCYTDLRSRGMGFASFLRDKTKAASESLKQRDWTREQQALSSIKTWGTG